MTITHKENTEYFDEIAEQYDRVDTNSLLLRHYSEIPSVFQVLGSLQGKSVLDISCSDGFFSRKIKQDGATRVVGVDLSDKMIELAQREEDKRPLGIEYMVSDVFELGRIGSFDLVFTPYLLNYARNVEELLTMCRIVHENLAPKGRFVSLNTNPNFNSRTEFEKYGKNLIFTRPIEDGDIFEVVLGTQGPEHEAVRFYNYHYHQATYTETLENAGFSTVHWHRPMVSQDGLQRFGADFWQDHIENPYFALIECVK